MGAERTHDSQVSNSDKGSDKAVFNGSCRPERMGLTPQRALSRVAGAAAGEGRRAGSNYEFNLLHSEE
jgi:hypothetical protein